MKKLITLSLAFSLVGLLLSGSAYAAIHIVQCGDTMPVLEKELGCSEEQIREMNRSLGRFCLYEGEAIVHVDNRDIKDAMQFLITEKQNTKPDDPYYKVVSEDINNLQDGVKCLPKDVGLPFYKCIKYAEKWRATQKK